MREYHKIQSVYKRDPVQNNKRFLVGEWSMPEFEYLSMCDWTWTEKVDGTNVRIGWDGPSETVTLGGRTADAQMPVFLIRRLTELFHATALRAVFGDGADIMLVGEGYGAKIQKVGGLYKPDGVDFILFDALVGDVWLERHNVEDIAAKLGIDVVPIVGRGTLLDAIDTVKAPRMAGIGQAPSEGLVMRPSTELRTRGGHRIIAKVKHRDFA